MKTTICNQLKQIEKKYEVKILWAIESGSRSWGFDSPDSDYDVRFIYIHKPAWYLSVFEQKDVIELPVNETLDISGWDIRKALCLFKKSNPVLLEWLVSPFIYKKTGSFQKGLMRIAPQYFSRKACAYHYLHMAENNYHREIKNKRLVKLKKYFYVLRPLLNILWLKEKNTIAPMSFVDTLESISIPSAIKKEINILLKRKKCTSELGQGSRIKILDDFIGHVFSVAKEYCSQAPEYAISHETLDNLFITVLSETWNISLAEK